MARRTTMSTRLGPSLFALVAMGTVVAAAPGLTPGANVRFQGHPASELSPGWHTGTVITTGKGCSMVATPDPKLPGGRRVLGLLFIQKLERRDGANWIDVPVKALMDQEPKHCRDAVGG